MTSNSYSALLPSPFNVLCLLPLWNNYVMGLPPPCYWLLDWLIDWLMESIYSLSFIGSHSHSKMAYQHIAEQVRGNNLKGKPLKAKSQKGHIIHLSNSIFTCLLKASQESDRVRQVSQGWDNLSSWPPLTSKPLHFAQAVKGGPP